MSVSVVITTGAQPLPWDSLGIEFDGRYGQVEVGGAFAGVEFHGSRPVPARISFYYPVANSIDLSTDYWRRDESRPLSFTISIDGHTDSLGTRPWAYTWTPYSVLFRDDTERYSATIAYRFTDGLPIVVVRLVVRNTADRSARFELDSRLVTSIRTSHRYATREPDAVGYADGGSSFVASFDAADTDSASLFVTNAGAVPEYSGRSGDGSAAFRYARTLQPNDSLVVIQLIGMSRQGESASIRKRSIDSWEDGVASYERGIRQYVRERGHVGIPDPELLQTDRLSRALLRANRHYLDGRVVPMPSPAEYNFFFTHDLLLTDLGGVIFDTDRVRDDLQYVQSLVLADSVLPHARYWRDSTYVVEFANRDNWNHLWFVQLAASYLKHSGDHATVEALFPTLQKSLELMLTNESGGLMYAERPDWWDIGHVRGPRAYLTALAVRAIESYAFIVLELGRDDPRIPTLLETAERMRRALVDRLWDENAGYLLNGLDSTTVDRHYYSGSLIAGVFGLIDDDRQNTLLETARRELLDPEIGLRNAMPADFHLLTDSYRFLEGEVGEPFLYMNGGVWPQGNAWYVLALIEAGRVDEAREALRRYFSLAGIERSPNGQPAFYEYRNADPSSPEYGAVDKPTFLWAGGWYLNALHRLTGVRESPWNLSFRPHLPTGWEAIEYDVALGGERTRVRWSGSGPAFHRIIVDGTHSASAVITAPAREIHLVRGLPTAPYLADASAIVERVERTDDDQTLIVHLRSVVGQHIDLEIVGPLPQSRILINGSERPETIERTEDRAGAVVTRVRFEAGSQHSVVRLGP